MELVNKILELFWTMSYQEAFFWLLIQNILQFAFCMVGGHLLIMFFQSKRIYQAPQDLSKFEVGLSILCVVMNTLVALAGWQLWKMGIITINREISLYCLIDVIALLAMMDFFMYLTHRIVHIKGIYELVHKTHHQYELTRPLSLFVLSPLEVIGFGLLWLVILTLYPSSWLGIVIYLLINAAFGALGHIGVEPYPKFYLNIPILNRFTTSTFHAQHHKEIDSNFGFYTDIWDRAYGTINKGYKTLFKKVAV